MGHRLFFIWPFSFLRNCARVALSSEVRKIQRRRLSQPRRMGGVILEVIAGLRVDQDVQAVAVRLEHGTSASNWLESNASWQLQCGWGPTGF